ncbi:Retaining alpha-galactosidase [termite gut metagenome]|uniref:Retaining alpha-galactosidase n=1 Tax=termite gut metagenome TaxID=433724 RepID=A0A5J4S5V0_9ZZZZ
MKQFQLLSGMMLLCFLGILVSTCQMPKHYSISSPDRSLDLRISQKGGGGMLTYSFTAAGTMLIDRSVLGFLTESGDTVPSAAWSVESFSSRKVDEVWNPVWGKRKVVADCFHELTLNMVSKSAPCKLQIIARVYDDGIAFRYVVPEKGTEEVSIDAELTEYNFAGNYTAWFYNGEYHNIGPEKLSDTDEERLPVMTVKADDSHYLAIHEAALSEEAPLTLISKEGETRFTVASQPDSLYPGYTSAWRVILYGSTPGKLTDSHLIELLNPQPKPEYDFSWVKPGVALWDWRINGAVTDDGFLYKMTYLSWVRMIDFAVEQGFSYLVLDANWYGPEHESSSNPVKGDKAEDVKRILKYGKDKGIGVWLYLNDVGGRKYPIEETLKQYGEWGASGVKYGFMQGNPKEKNKWTQKITELCAQNKLLVDFHDSPVHPYGQMRTWPNAVTREYCQAQLDAHRVFEPKTFVTSVFVNMVAGPLDMNNGMFDLRQGKTTRVDESIPVPSTVVSEAARTLVVFSGATILPDIPEFYRKYPALLDFISAQKMPWLESKTLAGEIGEYIVMMRQTDEAYLVAAVTNESGRIVELPLSFLGEGTYNVVIVEDGDKAHYLTNRETWKITGKQVTATDKLQLKLAPGGGACLIFKR